MIFLVVAKKRFLAARFGPVNVRKDNFARIGMDILQKADGSAELTQLEFTDSFCLTAIFCGTRAAFAMEGSYSIPE